MDTTIDRASGGRWADVQASIAAGFHVGTAHSWSRSTLLHEAAFQNHASMTELLLMAGADPNARDRYGVTPLWRAAASGYSSHLLRLLIAGGGDVNASHPDGRTPAIALVRRAATSSGGPGDLPVDTSGHWQRECLEALLCQPELDLSLTYLDLTAEEWAVEKCCDDLALLLCGEVGAEGWG